MIDESIAVLSLLLEHDVALKVFRYVGATLVVAGGAAVVVAGMPLVPVPLALLLAGALLLIMLETVPMVVQVFV